MSLLSYWGILFQSKVNKKIQHVQLADPSAPAPMRSFSELYLTDMSDSVDIVVNERMAAEKDNLLRVIRRLIKKNKQLYIIELVKAFSDADIRYIYDMDTTVKFYTSYIDPKGIIASNEKLEIDINSYMLFGPVFFASVGLQTNLRSVDMTILAFSVAFVIVGLLGKVVGCGIIAKLMKYNTSDSLKIGVGMMTRGEVALIVAQRGLKAEIVDSRYFTAVILLIILSSILTPIILKAIYASDEKALNH